MGNGKTRVKGSQAAAQGKREPAGGAAAAVSEEAIRLKAFSLYEARGRSDGHAVEDWLEAQAQLTAAASSAGSAGAMQA